MVLMETLPLVSTDILAPQVINLSNRDPLDPNLWISHLGKATARLGSPVRSSSLTETEKLRFLKD